MTFLGHVGVHFTALLLGWMAVDSSDDSWFERCQSDWAKAEAYGVALMELRKQNVKAPDVSAFDDRIVTARSFEPGETPCVFFVMVHLRADPMHGYILELSRDPARLWPDAWTVNDVRSW